MTPDLNQPYRTPREREEAREVIVSSWRLIELLMRLADFSPDQWTADRVRLLPGSPAGNIREHPSQRLDRWLSLYSEEIQVVRAARNLIVHAEDLDDPQLRGTEQIARVILATLFDKLPSEIDKNWLRSKTEEVWQQIVGSTS
jgi:hypothetical protein